jgi:hypothetical protein
MVSSTDAQKDGITDFGMTTTASTTFNATLSAVASMPVSKSESYIIQQSKPKLLGQYEADQQKKQGSCGKHFEEEEPKQKDKFAVVFDDDGNLYK